MRYKTYIDWTGTGYTEFFANNVSPFRIARELPNRNIMQFFSRISWGKVQISNDPYMFSKTGSTIYRLFDVINALDFSIKILIKHETTLMTTIGYFSRNDCFFDYDRKIITVTPAIIDQYTPIFENWENEIDFTKYVYDGVKITANIASNTIKVIQDWPTNEGTVHGGMIYPRNRVKEADYNDNGLLTYFDGEKPKSTLFKDSYWGFQAVHNVWDNQDPNFEAIPNAPYYLQDRIDILGQSISSNPADSNYGPSLDMHYGDYELSAFRIYEGTNIGGLSGSRWRQLYCTTEFTREETKKVDVVDLNNNFGFQSPVGDGWNMRVATTSGGRAAHIWTRKPFNGDYSQNWELGTEVVETSNFPDNGPTYYKYLETRLRYANSSNNFELLSTITLRNFIDYVVNSSDPEIADFEVKSTFFFNDFENEIGILDGTTGFNYVTGKKNNLNNLRLYFTRNLLTLDKNEVKDIPKYSLKSILDEFNTAFLDKLIWFIDANGYLRVEHVKYIDLVKTRSIDISDNPLLIDTTKYEFDKSQMFERFEYKQENAGYIDFTDNYVAFDKIVSNNRNKDLKYESKTQLITTDLKYCIFNPSNLADGFILLAFNPITFEVENKLCILSNEVELNGSLALSNLLLDFGRYDGVDVTGIINGRNENFATVLRNKLGIELTLKGTVEYLFYITQLGYGLIDSGEIDFEKEYTKIKLRYRYNSSINTDLFALSFQNSWDFEGAQSIWADQDNYIKS